VIDRLFRKDDMMRSKFALALLATAAGACSPTMTRDAPAQGLASVNVPVVTRSDYAFDVAAPNGYLAPTEAARLDAWFQGLNLGYGDTISLDGPYAEAARGQVAEVAGRYGMLVARSAPVTSGAVPPGAVRVVVSRTVASVPGCPNWSEPSQPNHMNRTMSNYGCAVNANLAAMVANPVDLVHGRAGDGIGDTADTVRAISTYRGWPVTAVVEGQTRRPLEKAETKKGDK
jgi:pilus assembly protein CpaD